MINVTIPLDTPTSDYWLGVIYDNGIDADGYNNDSDGWDAVKIHITQRQTFADVPASHWAGAWIKKLASDGITSGCGSGNYCPDADVNRDQMAVFLTNTFNLYSSCSDRQKSPLPGRGLFFILK